MTVTILEPTMTGTIPERTGTSGEMLAELAKACNVRTEEIEDVYACTPFQNATMVETATRPGSNVLRVILRLGDKVDLDRFCAVFEQVVAANNVFRTRIVDSSTGMLQVITSKQFSMQRYSGQMGQYLKEDKAIPMDWGCCLFRGAIVGRRLVLSMHHSIIDNSTTPAILQDSFRMYHGGELKIRTPYKAFAEFCSRIDEAEATSFWASRFKGNPAVFPKLEAGHFPKPTNVIKQKVTWRPDMPEVSTVHIPSIVESAWALTAKVYTGSDSISFGIVLSGRSPAMQGAGMGDTLGPTIVAVPVQVDLRPDMRVGELLKERTAARRQLQSARSLQWGLTKIRAVSEAARSASAFQTMLNLRPFEANVGDADEIVYESTVEPLAAFSLCLNCDMAKDGLIVEAASDPSVISNQQLRRVINQFEHFLHEVAYAGMEKEIKQIPLLSGADQAEILEWNSQVPQGKEACVHDVFSAQARTRPNANAVEAADGTATYAELDRWSTRLAHELRRKGLQTGDTVAFIFEKSLWTVVSVFAILKAGGTCVPVERADPLGRKETIIAASKAKLALASSTEYKDALSLVANVIEVNAAQIEGLPDLDDEALKSQVQVTPNDVAYIIFTSGSTGKPKGVMLEHRSLATSLQHLADRLGWGPHCRVLQFAAHVWDISMGEIFGSLLYGGCLCIPSDASRQSGLASFVTEKRVNWAWLTPTVSRTITPEQVPTLEALLTIGEPVAPEACKTWGKALRFVNGWGPCEASILCTTGQLLPDTPYPESIGIAVNCATWIVNPSNPNELAPIGAIGELLIEGHTVARGYLDDEAKTVASFVPPPPWIPSSRNGSTQKLYRTGDLAKYYPDGTIHFLGRQDSQVKIRGQRFELGEVEGVVKSLHEVREVVCRTRISRGRTELVAVVTLTDPQLPQTGILEDMPADLQERAASDLRFVRDVVRSKLPSFMVPTAWLAVQRLPRTPSAKLDRVSIADWLKGKDLKRAKEELEGQVELTAPVTKEEVQLQAIWSSVLNIPKSEIGRESAFVLLGGDSILAMQATSRCAQEGLSVNMVAMLANKPLQEVAIPAPLATAVNGNSSGSNGEKETNAPATDAQGLMLAVGEAGTRRGYLNDFILDFTPALDDHKLKKACDKVIHHHPILRTAFLIEGPSVQQRVYDEIPIETVLDEVNDGSDLPPTSNSLGLIFPKFHISATGGNCHRLRLEIHHALYDAMSLHLMFEDLKAAYNGQKLSNGPSFHAVLSASENADKLSARNFWTEKLQGSTMSYLVKPNPQGVLGLPLDGCERITVPLEGLQQTPSTTASTVFKAAWALLLSHALGTDDVVFGEVSANRFQPIPLISKVKGPCINFLPVRAKLQETSTLASLAADLQEAFTASLPHHFLGYRDTIKNSTTWPRWTRFSSMVVFQNHASLDTSTSFDNSGTQASLSARDRLGDTTDMWVIATPGVDTLDVELRFTPTSVPTAEALWISRCLTLILESFAKDPDTTLGLVKNVLNDSLPAYVVPPARPTVQPSVVYDYSSPPTAEAVKEVSDAWVELDLGQQQKNDDGTSQSMFDSGADIVTALVLSKKYLVSIEDVLAHPTQLEQAYMLDARTGSAPN